MQILVQILVQRHNWAIFLRKLKGGAVAVNGDRYRAMLNEFLFTKIKEEDIGSIWFQQETVTAATCHTAKTTLNVLCSVFADRIINRKAGHLVDAI